MVADNKPRAKLGFFPRAFVQNNVSNANPGPGEYMQTNKHLSHKRHESGPAFSFSKVPRYQKELTIKQLAQDHVFVPNK